MGLMTSRLRTFRARSILLVLVVPKLILLFTREGLSAQPFSINFDKSWVCWSDFQALYLFGFYFQVETELIDKLDILVSENKGDDDYKQLFNAM